MREQEEQLNILRKENFNLKLRVYFLEEQKSENTSYEACNKQNIELKVIIFFKSNFNPFKSLQNY